MPDCMKTAWPMPWGKTTRILADFPRAAAALSPRCPRVVPVLPPRCPRAAPALSPLYAAYQKQSGVLGFGSIVHNQYSARNRLGVTRSTGLLVHLYRRTLPHPKLYGPRQFDGAGAARHDVEFGEGFACAAEAGLTAK